MGARAGKDGLDGVQVNTTNTANLPVEALESEHPGGLLFRAMSSSRIQAVRESLAAA